MATTPLQFVATRMLVVVGGSGVGKSTLIDHLLEHTDGDFAFLADTTTRARRATERAGAADKIFVSRQEFARMVHEHRLASWFRNGINDEYYGTEWRLLWDIAVGGKILVTTVDCAAAEKTLRKLRSFVFGQFLAPVAVWIRPESVEALEARLRGAGRGHSADAEVEQRLRANRVGHASCEALERQGSFDAVVVNDDLRSAKATFLEIGRAVARRKRWLWLSWLSPLRVPVLYVVGTWINVLTWMFLGAAHCDRPRLRKHALSREYKGAAGLHGLAPSLELVPVAGGKPNVVLWCLLPFLVHVVSCALYASPLTCPGSGGQFHGAIVADCATLAEWSVDPRGWDLLSRVAFAALLAITVLAWVVHDTGIGNSPIFQRFKVSFTHFTLRWFGPVPALMILLLGRGRSWLLIALVALQGLVLAAHWLVKGVVKRLAPGVDPSGHARVCLNTLIYFALLSSAAGELGISPVRIAAASVYVAAQLATVLVSGWAHHTSLDLVLGYLCVFPQLALLRGLLANADYPYGWYAE